MDNVAIVHYQRDANSKVLAVELADKLRAHELRGELRDVAHASAHELIYFDAVVLAGPLHFSRMHGLSLVKASFGYKPTALLLTGAGDDDRVLRLLPKHMRGEVPVFAVDPTHPTPTRLDPLVAWLRSVVGTTGYRWTG